MDRHGKKQLTIFSSLGDPSANRGFHLVFELIDIRCLGSDACVLSGRLKSDVTNISVRLAHSRKSMSSLVRDE